LFLLISLLYSNKNKIIDGKIGTAFYRFSNIIIFLFFLQMYFIFTGINTDISDKGNTTSKRTNGIIYLINLLIFICYLIQYVILVYFTTDG